MPNPELSNRWHGRAGWNNWGGGGVLLFVFVVALKRVEKKHRLCSRASASRGSFSPLDSDLEEALALLCKANKSVNSECQGVLSYTSLAVDFQETCGVVNQVPTQ